MIVVPFVSLLIVSYIILPTGLIYTFNLFEKKNKLIKSFFLALIFLILFLIIGFGSYYFFAEFLYILESEAIVITTLFIYLAFLSTFLILIRNVLNLTNFVLSAIFSLVILLGYIIPLGVFFF